jgi:protease-4
LREGKWEGQSGPKPVVVAMESIAASGGYYLAAPADRIVAQPTTITGSIGIFAAIPDLSRVPEKYGIDLKVLKRGELKGLSMFRKMTPAEAQNIEDLLEHGYQRFMQVVQEGRGKRLKHALRDPLPVPEDKLTVLENGEAYVRRLADGGIFTADEALKYGLIDEIGYLDDAVRRARELAGLTEARVITYAPPTPLWRSLLGVQADPPERGVSLDHVPGLTARFWYLTPGYELSGVCVPHGWVE